VIIDNTLREELSIRFPNVEFAPYFSFLESCPLQKRKDSEQHHILPQKEFPEHKKNPNNLINLLSKDHLIAHYWLALCAPKHTAFQRTFFLMSNLRKTVYQLLPEEVSNCAKIYEQGRALQRKAVRPFGIIYGAKNVENGHLDRIRPSPEVNRIQGRKNVENGHLAYCRTLVDRAKSGAALGKWSVESGHVKRAAAIAGQRNKESGWAAELGRKAVENGLWDRIRKTNNHVRWHVNRNTLNPNCKLCLEKQDA
jgi:hypothetical protein